MKPGQLKVFYHWKEDHPNSFVKTFKGLLSFFSVFIFFSSFDFLIFCLIANKLWGTRQLSLIVMSPIPKT